MHEVDASMAPDPYRPEKVVHDFEQMLRGQVWRTSADLKEVLENSSFENYSKEQLQRFVNAVEELASGRADFLMRLNDLDKMREFMDLFSQLEEAARKHL